LPTIRQKFSQPFQEIASYTERGELIK